MNEEMDISIKQILLIIKQRLLLIISITVGTVIIAGIISFVVIKPVYEAKTSIIVGKPSGSTSGVEQSNDIKMYQDLVKTYSEIATSDLVAQGAVDKLKGSTTIGKIKGGITVTTKPGTQILEFDAKGDNPKEAFDIASAVASSFIKSSKTIYPTNGVIQVMDKAVMPTSPISPDKNLNLLIGLILGLMISAGVVLFLEYSNSTIVTESDVEKYLDLPILGIIPKVTDEIK
ncbi:capsular biosynthesis protein [Clostridium algoriphilum]|uniref:YveK family protein n=1 Tax=Clostridium algoriphilum TaxID=198347 RepID=UPI001CF30AED|nr:Wzz/FepE/Etk N-terminal domain-containing protein [Clostridium algoriphilum]MCB2293943.1 capsular biosynthesis protein [Clostridium algoriphilum]